MKNIFKKAAALAVAGIMSVSALTACAQEVTLLDFIEADTGKTDFYGYVCKLGMYTRSDNTGMLIDENNPFGYKENTELADAVLARISDIENDLNCSIELSLIDVDGDVLAAQLFADSVKQEVLYSPSHALTRKYLAAAGYLEKVNNYGDYIDYTNTEKYGEINIQEMNAVNGDLYAVSPITWMFKQPRALELIVINEDLRSKYNTPRIQEYIENGVWNWDSFEEFIANSSNKDNEETPIYSLSARGFDVAKLLAYGNGFVLATETADGYVTDFGADNMMEAAQFYYDLRAKYSENFAPDTGDWVDVNEHFIDLKDSVACLTAASILYNDIVYEIQNYSVAPFPTGPRGEYGKWPSAIEATESFSVFNTGENPEANFTIIDRLCDPLEGVETEEDRFEYLSTNVVFTIEDAEYAMNLYKNGMYTHWVFSDSAANGFDDLWRAGIEDGAVDGDDPRALSEVMEELKNIYPALIEEFIVPNFPVYELIPN